MDRVTIAGITDVIGYCPERLEIFVSGRMVAIMNQYPNRRSLA
jgi:hypothetical protein